MWVVGARVPPKVHARPLRLVRPGTPAHISDGAQVDDDRGEVLADHGHVAVVGRHPGLAGAGAECDTAPSFDPHVVGVAATFVGDGVEAGLVAAYCLGLSAEPVGGLGELLLSLNLDHLLALRFNSLN